MSKPRARVHWYVVAAQVLIVGLLALQSSRPAAAEDDTDPPSRVARLSYLRGSVSFEPAGESEWVEATANRPLTTGDRLWTDTGDARAELTTGSATIRLDASTDFAFINLDDRTVQMQLAQGTVTVRVKRLRRDEIVEVDTPNQAFSILQAGSYRVEASEDGSSTLVTVRDGEGEASGGGDTYAIHAGQSTRLTGTDRLEAADLRVGRLDDFDEWGQTRDRRSETSPSARYVSPEVVGYEDLDDNGTWRTDPSYGQVWVPTRTAPGWAPYHDGHWAWISPWGYTWVDDAPWGYAPFHYGRWVTIGGRWGWVPGPVEVRAVYAPALVVFIGGPSFSVAVGGGGSRAEVGWFPLGPREVYVPAYHVSRAYVDRVNVSNTRVSNTTITNVYNTQVTNNYQITNVKYANRTAPGGVTVVPQQAFTSAQPVARTAVKVNEQRIAEAPIGATAGATPTRNAVFGTSKVESAQRPPAAAASRSVVAKAPPPPPPVPFASQQHALEAHPGQPLAKQEVESVRPPATATMQSMVRQAPPGKPAERAAQPPAPKAAEQVVQQPGAPKPAERAAQPPAPKAAEQVVQQPGAPKPAERAAQPPAAAPMQSMVRQAPPGKPAERAAQPPAPKAAEQVVQQPGAPKPAERAAQPPATKAAEQVVQQPSPSKPAERTVQQPGAQKPPERVAQPPAPKAAEQAVQQPNPSKPAERAPQPPPPKAAEQAVQQPSPSKPAERTVQQPAAPKPTEHVVQPPAPKTAEHVPGPSKPNERVAQPPPPSATARAPQHTEPPPTPAQPRPKEGEKEKHSGPPSPAQEKTPR